MKYYIQITPFFPSEESFFGPYIYDQVKALKEVSDYEVIVIKLSISGGDEDYDYQGIRVHQVKLWDLPSNFLPGLTIQRNFQKIYKKIAKLTSGQFDKIEYIHGHVTYPCGVYAVKLAEKVGAASLVQHHGLDVLSYSNGRLLFGGLRRLNKKWINKIHVPYLNKASWNLGVSKKTLDALHKVPSFIGHKEYVLYNGVNKEKFYPMKGLKDSACFVIGCIGNFWELKDQITLIKAVEALLKKDIEIKIKVIFVGEGVTKQECLSYTLENNIQEYFEFRGTMDHTELNAFYNSLNLFILPSFYEALGCVYLEAFSCGVPFVGVKGQGIEELVNPEQQEYYLIEQGDFAGLSDLIQIHLQQKTKQLLKRDIDINLLVAEFLNEISN